MASLLISILLAPCFTLLVARCGLFFYVRRFFHWPGYPADVWTMEYLPYVLVSFAGLWLAYAGYRRSRAKKTFILSVFVNVIYATYFMVGLIGAWGTPFE